MLHAASSSPPVPSLRGGEVQLWRISSALDDGRLAHLYERLGSEERARADRFRSRSDRTTYVVSHAALRTLVGAHRGIAPERIALTRDGAGKPHLVDGFGPNFSLSRSGDRALIGIAPEAVGVDIECGGGPKDAEPIARRYFTPCEARRLESLGPPDRETAFLACWTRKEAIVKALGLGLAVPLDSFDVGVGHAEATVHLPSPGGGYSAWSLRSGRDGATHYAVATETPNARFRLFSQADTARYALLL